MPTYKSYIIGFLLSLVLTLTAYFAVVISAPNSLLIILMLAVIQLVVQLVFFLHVGQEKGPAWNLAVLISTFSIVLIVIVGSLWIMANLNYNMSPQQMDDYIMKSENMFK